MLFVDHLGWSHHEQMVINCRMERVWDTENHLRQRGVRTELTYRLQEQLHLREG